MDASEFKKSLENCVPGIEDLAKVGLLSDEVDELRRSFFIIKRKERLERIGLPGQLGELFKNYDPSNVEIGMLKFDLEPHKKNSSWVIGQVEADLLVVDTVSGEVCVEDLTSVQKHILWRCAKDGQSFLAAMLLAACFLGRCLHDERLASDKLQRNSCVDECVIAAGGELYRPFYQMLIGL